MDKITQDQKDDLANAEENLKLADTTGKTKDSIKAYNDEVAKLSDELAAAKKAAKDLVDKGDNAGELEAYRVQAKINKLKSKLADAAKLLKDIDKSAAKKEVEDAATNTDVKVDRVKLESEILQLDELIINQSEQLGSINTKEAYLLLEEAKKVFGNLNATQAEVDAMVKRIEDFMAKVAPSTDHVTPANDQVVQTPANANQEAANARKAAKELPNTGTADSTVAMVAAAASVLLGLGLAGRRRKEDEEA